MQQQKFLSRKLAFSCLGAGLLTVFSVFPAWAEVYKDPQILSDKQQWQLAGLFSSPKAALWLNEGINRHNGVPSAVKSIEIISFTFNKNSRKQIASLSPVPFDKIGLISAYAVLTLENGQKDSGVILIDNPGEKEKVRAYWIPAAKISAFFEAGDRLKSGGKPIPAFRGPASFTDPEVQDCVAQSYLIRPVTPEEYPYQRWVRCTDPEVRQQILYPHSLVPVYNGS